MPVNVHIAGIILAAAVALAFGWGLFLVGRHQKVIVEILVNDFRETLQWFLDLETRSKILLFLAVPLTFLTLSVWS